MDSSYTVYYALSIASALLSLLLIVMYYLGVFRTRINWPFQPAYVGAAALFLLADFFVIFPIYLADPDKGGFYALATAIHSSLQAFTLDIDAEGVISGITSIHWLRVYVAFLLLFSPVLTIGALLSLLKDFFSSIRLRFSRRSRNISLYIFSELNNESLTLAQSFRAHEFNEEFKRKNR